MAKNTPTPPEPAVEVDSTALIITTETINKALATYHPIKAELAEIVKEYAALTIKDTKDKVGLAAVTVAYKNAREIRLKVENIRKAINDAPLTLQRMNNAAAKELTELAKPCEDQLKAKIDAIETAVELENRAEEARRNKMLQDAGYQMSGSFWICGPYQIAWTSIMEMTADALEQAVANATAHQQEQARLLEEKRIAEEAAEQERRLKAKELAEREAKLKAEEEAHAKERAEFAAWKAAQTPAAAPAPVAIPAGPATYKQPTHAVTVHQKDAPQTIVEPVSLETASARLTAKTEFKSAAVEVSPEFAFGFNTCKALVVADLANESLVLSRKGWHDRFVGMDAPATRVFEFIQAYKTMRNLQVKYFREKTQENLIAAKNQEKFLDELARSL